MVAEAEGDRAAFAAQLEKDLDNIVVSKDNTSASPEDLIKLDGVNLNTDEDLIKLDSK